MPITRLPVAIVPLLATLLIGGQGRSEDLKFSSMHNVLREQALRIDQLEAELVSFREDSAAKENGAGKCNGCGKGSGYGDCGCSSAGLIGGLEATVMTAHNSALAVDIGAGLVSLTPDYNAQVAPRVWLGYQGASGLGFKATYWGYDQTATGSDVAGALGGDVALGLMARTVDLELMQSTSFCRWDLGVSGGLRWARLEDELSILGPAGQLALRRDFEGVGGTVALGARRPVGQRGFALLGGARMSLVYGESDAQIEDTLIGLPTVTLTADDQVLSIYELRLGGEWSRELNSGARVVAQLVYEAQTWNVPPVFAGLLDSSIGFTGPAFSLAIER